MLFARDFLTDQIVLGETGGPDPVVSVILPTYRRRDAGLEAAIASVLAQSFSDLELLVMDDGSNDGSAELIEGFRARDPRVIHVRHERNSGLPALRVNEGIELGRGRYFAFQFDDDVWRPRGLGALVSEAERHSDPAVVVGRSRFKGRTGEWTMPAVELSLVTLYEQNRFANNSVLLPRVLVDQYGLYDCHIGMRRLCDWDLWLRYVRQVPFVTISDLVSEVFEANQGSIGLTVPWDLSLFRIIHDIPRDHLLSPATWRDYPVDSMRIGEVEIGGDARRRLYEDHLVPFYLRFRHHFPDLEGFPATLPSARKQVLYTKNSYDVSNDVTLNHYDKLSSQRSQFKARFEPLPQVDSQWMRDADSLLLVRTVEDRARHLLATALESGVPAGVYLDDDLLSFHEYGPEFDYLAPGTPYHANLSRMVADADAVWTTNSFLEEAVRPLNPRIIPHNNAVPEAFLPRAIRPRMPKRALKIGYVGSGYRIEEFKRIWDGLARISERYGDRLTFEFWGLDVGGLSRLASPVQHRPFTFSYLLYLRQLREAGFDILLSPLLDRPRPRLAKSLIKYYETAVAGALGIFSDVPQYAALPAELTCLKAGPGADAWYGALERAIDMPPREFDLMRTRLLAHVREEYTEKAQIHKHEAAWRATEFHSRTRSRRYPDGRPRVVYVLHSAHFGGGEIQLWRRLRRARAYGIEPVVVLPRILQQTPEAIHLANSLEQDGVQVEFVEYTCFDSPRSPSDFRSERERTAVREILERSRPALVHTVTFIPSVGQVCGEMGIPHVASLYAVQDAFGWADGRAGFRHAQLVQSDSIRYATRWGQLLEVESFCAREVAPEEVFALGQRRSLESLGGDPPASGGPSRLVVTGTIQERKRQLETIEAFGRLRQEGFDGELEFHGYTHFFPEYMSRCRESVEALGLQDRVRFHGFSSDVVRIMASADVVLSLSDYESFPSAIKEAMAAGVLVVATPVGGISELILDGVTGILCRDLTVEGVTEGLRRALTLPPEERRRMVEQARRVARSEFHPQRAMNDLLTMYNRALEVAGGTPRRLPEAAASPPLRLQPGTVESPTLAPASHILIDRHLSYELVPSRPKWTGIDVMVGTHGKPAAGSLRLDVLSTAGAPLRSVTVDLGRVRDNDWVSFRFPAIVNAAGTPFVAQFRLCDHRPGTCVSLYEASPPEIKLRRLLRRSGLRLDGNALYFRSWYAEV